MFFLELPQYKIKAGSKLVPSQSQHSNRIIDNNPNRDLDFLVKNFFHFRAQL